MLFAVFAVVLVAMDDEPVAGLELLAAVPHPHASAIGNVVPVVRVAVCPPTCGHPASDRTLNPGQMRDVAKNRVYEVEFIDLLGLTFRDDAGDQSVIHGDRVRQVSVARKLSVTSPGDAPAPAVLTPQVERGAGASPLVDAPAEQSQKEGTP